MDIYFEGRSVLVTGAARGIGQGIVEAFATRGAKVFATDILEEELVRLKATVKTDRGGSIEARTLDVTDPIDVTDRVREMEAECGGFDIFVHVAGGVRGQSKKPVEQVTPQEWDDIYDVNVKGAFLVASAVVPRMKARRQGKIVMISSGAGLGISLTGIQAYASAKAGQLGLMRQLGHELGPFGINVNAIAPGFLRTSPDYERQWNSYGEAGQKAMIEEIPLRRLGEPRDIAHAVLFLASDYASWITGQVLPVSGGPT
ncbi:SDR family NAD(P)-dependent oxidoreductase [Microvirga sp. 2TAF3]|uniref:SDR family NAD(P)-dependent oxidoreductase n=1 Tax=Microvirga sp. 2TAF3 TaxID=3233014 RepID=UPI003F9D61A0